MQTKTKGVTRMTEQRENGINIEMVVECLRDLAVLQDDGFVDPAGMYHPQDIRDQADALEALDLEKWSADLKRVGVDKDATADDFAKLYRFDDIGQVLVFLETNDEGAPSLFFKVQPEGLGICSCSLNFKDSGDGWDKAERAFADTDKARAEKVVRKSIFEPLNDAGMS